MNLKAILHTIRNGLFNKVIAYNYLYAAVLLLLMIYIGFIKILGYSMQDIITLYPLALILFLIATILTSMFWICRILEANTKKICEKYGVDVIE